MFQISNQEIVSVGNFNFMFMLSMLFLPYSVAFIEYLTNSEDS